MNNLANISTEFKRPTQLELLMSSEQSTKILPISEKIKTKKATSKVLISGNVDAGKNFDNYLASDSNNYVCNIIKAISKDPGGDYPLAFLIGPTGMGKSHLLMSVANENKNKKVVYFNAVDFKYAFNFYNQKSNKISFAEYIYQNCDIFLLDDVQEILSATNIQSELCLIIDLFKQNHKQVIISSLKGPRELKTIGQRLKGRVDSSLQIKIPYLCQHLSKNYIELLVTRYGVTLPFEVKCLVSESFQNHFNEIESAILKLKSLYDGAGKRQIFLEDAIVSLKSLGMMREFNDSSRKIIESVADFYSITVSELCSRSRRPEYSRPRHISMYLLNKKAKMSHNKIGKLFQRDHTSILYAVSKIEKQIEQDQSLKEVISKFM